MIQLTHKDNPDEMIDSCYGKLSYREWLIRERDRINKRSGRNVEVVQDDRGRLFLLEKNFKTLAKLAEYYKSLDTYHKEKHNRINY